MCLSQNETGVKNWCQNLILIVFVFFIIIVCNVLIYKRKSLNPLRVEACDTLYIS